MRYQIGEYGQTITVDCEEDISSGTNFIIVVESPSGTRTELTGTLNGSRKIDYVVQSGDFDEVGTWRLQSKVVYASAVYLGTITCFEISAAL